LRVRFRLQAQGFFELGPGIVPGLGGFEGLGGGYEALQVRSGTDIKVLEIAVLLVVEAVEFKVRVVYGKIGETAVVVVLEKGVVGFGKTGFVGLDDPGLLLELLFPGDIAVVKDFQFGNEVSDNT
jgi:hypothetical protein